MAWHGAGAFLCASIAAALATGAASADEVVVRSATTGASVRASSDRVVIRPRASLSPAEVAALHRDHGCSAIKRMPLSRLEVVALPAGASVEAVLSAYAADARVELAEADILFSLARVPDDPLYPYQPHLAQIAAPSGWDLAIGSEAVVVAVIDSGVYLDHPDLAGNTWRNAREVVNGEDDDGNGYIDDLYGWDFIDDDGVPVPVPSVSGSGNTYSTNENVTHGTRVAGCIAAIGNNGIGVTGAAWNAKLMALKVFPAEGAAHLADIGEAILYAVRNGAQIINLSLGAGFTTALDDAIAEAFESGALIVAAAGNSGADLDAEPQTPVSNDGDGNRVLGVAAVDAQDRKAGFSSYGAAVDLCAPGVGICTTSMPVSELLGDLYGYGSGTSFSAPIVSGIAALVRSRSPSLSAGELRERLIAATDDVDSANPAYAGRLGSGRINARLAVSDDLALRPPAPSAPTPSNGAVVPAGAVELSWRGRASASADEVRYDVYFGPAEPPPLAATSLADPRLTVQGLRAGYAYRWRVVARNGLGYAAEGPLWGVVAGAMDLYEPDDAPASAKVASLDGALMRHELTVGDADYASVAAQAGVTYEFRTVVAVPGSTDATTAQKGGVGVRAASPVDTVLTLYDTDGTTVIAENDDIRLAQILASRILWTCQESGRYYIAVRGYGGLSAGPYDLVITPQLAPSISPPTVPADPSPPDLAVNVGTAVTLAWGGGLDPSGGPVVYDVSLSDGLGLAQFAEGISARTLQVSALEEGRAYCWQVRARGPGGQVSTGPLWRFAVGQSDPYEPDDSPSDAGAIRASGPSQLRAFSTPEDVDYVRFSAGAATPYTASVGPPGGDLPAAAAYLAVLSADGEQVLAEGEGMVAYTPAEAGPLVLRATSVGASGFYRLALAGEAAAPIEVRVSALPAELDYGAPLSVTATVLDAAGVPVPGAETRVRLSGQAALAGDVEFTRQCDASGTVRLDIPSAGFGLGPSGVSVEIAGVPASQVSTSFVTVLRHGFAVAGSGRGVGIIAAPVGGDPREALGLDPGAGHALADYRPSLSAYVYYDGSNIEVKPGRGYFVKSSEELRIERRAGTPPDPRRPYACQLERGWNLIGNPFTIAVRWDIDRMLVLRSGTPVGTLREGAALGLIEPYAWAYDSATDTYRLIFDAAFTPGRKPTLEAYEGAFLRANEDGVSLVLPAPDGMPLTSEAASPPRRMPALELVFTSDGEPAQRVYAVLGRGPLARALLPPAAPGAGQRLAAWFRSPVGPSQVAALELGASAEIEVRADGRHVSLACPDTRPLPRDLCPVLLDTATGRSYSLRSGASWSGWIEEGEVRRLLLSLEPEGGRLTVRVRDVLLGPRAAGCVVELSRAADVSAEVHNAAGRVVRTLQIGARAAGEVQIAWDGRSETGAALPAGEYVILVRARSADGQIATARAGVYR